MAALRVALPGCLDPMTLVPLELKRAIQDIQVMIQMHTEFE
jgi:hypothetical protein